MKTIMEVFPDENTRNLNNKPRNILGNLGAGGSKFGQPIRSNRRVLSVLNQNIIGGQSYPCVVNKRSLSDTNNGGSRKNDQPDPGHRPVTRKFAAQMASSQQLYPEEAKKAKTSVPESNEFGDCIFVDVEDQAPVENHQEPEILEESPQAASSDDVDPMEEDEVEDMLEEPVVDIDGRDKQNPLAVVEYIDDIYSYYRKVENCSCVSPSYMTQQFDINEKMRAILIDWLIEVHDKFGLRRETLFLTVNLIDRFLAKATVVRKKLQLVGLVAMLLACKYEEVTVPIVEDLILISDRAYSRQEILEMESIMLNTLQFNMSLPTPYVFMNRFLKAAESDKKLEVLSFFLIELSLVEYEMLKFPPSLVAAAAVYTAQSTLYGFKNWNRTCQWYSNYLEDQLLECSRMLVGYQQEAGTGKLTGVYRKYGSSKYGYTSKCVESAKFLLETQQQK